MAIHGGRGKTSSSAVRRAVSQGSAGHCCCTCRGTQPWLQLLAPRGLSCSWRVWEGNASLWWAGGTKPRGPGSFRFWLFYPLHVSHYLGFSLSQGKVKCVIPWLMRSAKFLPVQMPWEEFVPAKPELVCGFRVRSKKLKTSTAFPAQTAPCSPSLFCLPLIKVKRSLRADMSVWELPQLLFSIVNNGN